MQRLFLSIIIFIVTTYLIGCGGTSGKEPNSGNNISNKNSIEINKALKNKNYIQLFSNLKGFELSNDDTKIYGHGEAFFSVTDITKIYPIDKELYEFKNIARLEIPLPDASSLEMTKPNQSISSITISTDEKFAYLGTYDARHNGGKGTLIIVDISNHKKPKVVNRDTINLYFDDIIKVLPNGKHLLARTSINRGPSKNLTIIDIQDATKPKVAGSIKTGDTINAISISNDSKRAYIATDDTIEIINLEDPTLPIRITKIDRDYGDTLALVVTKNKKRMYASKEKSLQLYDIEKDNFKLIDSYQIDGDIKNIENLTLSDDENTLYATYYDMDVEPDNSLVIFDITDKDKLGFKKKVLAPDNTVLVYDVQNQALAPDEKKFYALQVYFYIINLEKH